MKNHFQPFGNILTVALLLLAMVPRAASAHDMKMAGVKVRLDGDKVTVSVVAHLHQLEAVDVASEVRGRLRLRLDGKPFVAERVRVTIDKANGIAMWQGEGSRVTERARSATTVAIDAPIFPEQAIGGTVLTVFRGGAVVGEALVTASHPRAEIGATQGAAPLGAVVYRFVREGVLHIFTGPDHMLFIFGLLLLGGSLKQLLKVVTAFTLAHSITLTLAATGACTLPSRLIEPAIALSIVAVAIENLRATETTRDVRPWLAFAFGLIHGFGFASALGEVGLPPHALGWALASFNIGVELGQATIVLICAPLLAWLGQARPNFSQRVVCGGSWGVAAMGAVWFVERVV